MTAPIAIHRGRNSTRPRWSAALPVIVVLGALVLGVRDGWADERLLWFSNGMLTPQAAKMVDALRDADLYGLRADDYAPAVSPSELRMILSGHAGYDLQARFDQMLTHSASLFATHLRRGRVNAEAAGFHLPADRSTLDAEGVARELAAASDVTATLASFEPRAHPYRLLKRALAQYRNLARQPGLNALPPLPSHSVAPGDNYRGASKLRTLLVVLGDLDPARAVEHEGETEVETELADAVRRFQNRHGLQADGVIGTRTYAALTAPFADRVRQIELTLERWRWLSALPRPDIVVNIPQFMLYALPDPSEAQERVIEMPVIVGQSHTRTPVFVAAIEQVIFQPFWDVPSSIVRKELLPRIRKDPAFLTRHHFEIVGGPGDDARVVEPTAAAIDALASGRLRLRQRPGPHNALGPVKFVLPNPYDVRLHGTPEQELFEQSRRAFSHGCIRVSEPAALAEYVLRRAPGKWDAAAIDSAICGTQTFRVKLQEPVRIVVFYATVAATESRGVLFSEDIYGHDRKLEELLGRRSYLKSPGPPSL